MILARTISRGLLAAIALAPAPTFASEPFQDILDVCAVSPYTRERAVTELVDLGWTDITSQDAYVSFMLESQFINARARLSAKSYPDPWTDDTVQQRWPPTRGESLDGLRDHIELYATTSADMFGHTDWYVLEDSETESRTLLLSGICYFVGVADENPSLRDQLLSIAKSRKASIWNRGRDYRTNVNASLLNEHGQAEDSRFPVKADLTFTFGSIRPLTVVQ